MQEQIEQKRNEIQEFDAIIENYNNQIADIRGQQQEELRKKERLLKQRHEEIRKRDKAKIELSNVMQKNEILKQEDKHLAKKEKQKLAKVQKEKKNYDENIKLHTELEKKEAELKAQTEEELEKMKQAKKSETLALRDQTIDFEKRNENIKKQNNQQKTNKFGTTYKNTNDYWEKKKLLKKFDQNQKSNHVDELFSEIDQLLKQIQNEKENWSYVKDFIVMIANFAKQRVDPQNYQFLKSETENFESLVMEKNLEVTIQRLIFMFKKVNELPKEKRERKIEKICTYLNIDKEDLLRFVKNNTPKEAMQKVIPKKFNPKKDKSGKLLNHEEGDGIINLDLMLEIHFWNENRGLLNDLYLQYEKYLRFVPNFMRKDSEYILDWAKRKNGILDTSDFPRALAIINRANVIVDGYQLRDVQVFAALLACRDKKNGKLLQINTGEGKTTITSIVAVLKSLQHDAFVDIMTSNDILAKEAVESREGFYALFGKSVSHNQDENYEKGLKKCYACDIVYGTISNFQIDYLRHNFKILGTKGTRGCNFLIIDEVDNVIIDNAGQISKISSSVPGFHYLNLVQINIWKALNDYALLNNIFEIEEDQFDDIKKGAISYIKSKEPIDSLLSVLPKFVVEYANYHLDDYIKSAIHARFVAEKDKDYITEKRDKDKNSGEISIIPVDFENTGVTLQNTIWSYGLHQFLQLKHNFHLTTENITSCFMSNMGYVKMYEDRIVGLTGTLGSKAETRFLNENYNVVCMIVPPFKSSERIDFRNRIIEDDNWALEILWDSLLIARYRAVLLILKTVSDVNLIQETFRKNFDNPEFHIRFCKDEHDVNVTRPVLEPGDILVSTNVSGRGTDLKTSKKLEQEGGLHVIVGFLQNNERILKQAFGRTNRTGNQGSVARYVRQSEIDSFELDKSLEVDELFKAADKKIEDNEASRLQNIKKNIESMTNEGKAFEWFRKCYYALKLMNKLSYPILQDIEYGWALTFEKRDNNVQIFLENLDKIVEQVRHGEYQHQFLNPYYALSHSHSILSQKESDIIDQIPTIFNQPCLKNDTEHLYPQFLMKFEFQFEKACVFINKLKKALGGLLGFENKENNQYKEDAKECLEKVKEGLINEINCLNDCMEKMSNIVDSNQKTEENLFLLHFNSKIASLEAILAAVQDLIGQINDYLFSRKDLVIKKKVASFLRDQNVQEALKVKIFKDELDELGPISLDYTYELEIIDDIPKETITKARSEIIAAIALLGVGLVFPPSEIAIAPVASELISIAVFDLIIALISKDQQPPDLKSTLQDYAMSLFTFGLSALLKCTKVINKARRLCQKFAKGLRKCKIFKRLKTKLATKVENLAIKLAKYNPGMKLPQGSFKNQLVKNLKNRGKHLLTEFISEEVFKNAEDLLKRALKEVFVQPLTDILNPVCQDIIDNKKKMEEKVQDKVINFLTKMISEALRRAEVEENTNDEENEQNFEDLIPLVQEFFEDSQRKLNIAVAFFSRFFNQVVKICHFSQEFFKKGIKPQINKSIKKVQNKLKLVKNLEDVKSLVDKVKDSINFFKDLIENIGKIKEEAGEIMDELRTIRTNFDNLLDKVKNSKINLIRIIINQSEKFLIEFVKEKINIVFQKFDSYLGIDSSSATNIAEMLSQKMFNVVFSLVMRKLKKLKTLEDSGKKKEEESLPTINFTNSLKNPCTFICLEKVFSCSMDQISMATGIFLGKEGASISEIEYVFESLNLKTKKRNVKDDYKIQANNFLETCQSFIGIAFMTKNKNKKGHAVNIQIGQQFILENDGIKYDENHFKNKSYENGVYMAPLQFKEAKRKETKKFIEKTESKYKFTTGSFKQNLFGNDQLQRILTQALVSEICVNVSTLFLEDFKKDFVDVKLTTLNEIKTDSGDSLLAIINRIEKKSEISENYAEFKENFISKMKKEEDPKDENKKKGQKVKKVQIVKKNVEKEQKVYYYKMTNFMDVFRFIFVFPNEEHNGDLRYFEFDEKQKISQAKHSVILHFKMEEHDKYAFLQPDLYLESCYDTNGNRFTPCAKEYLSKDPQNDKIIECLKQMKRGFDTPEKLNFVVPRFICESLRNNLVCIGALLRLKEDLQAVVPKGFRWDKNSIGKNGQLWKNNPSADIIENDTQDPYILGRTAFLFLFRELMKNNDDDDDDDGKLTKKLTKKFPKNLKTILEQKAGSINNN